MESDTEVPVRSTDLPAVTAQDSVTNTAQTTAAAGGFAPGSAHQSITAGNAHQATIGRLND